MEEDEGLSIVPLQGVAEDLPSPLRDDVISLATVFNLSWSKFRGAGAERQGYEKRLVPTIRANWANIRISQNALIDQLEDSGATALAEEIDPFLDLGDDQDPGHGHHQDFLTVGSMGHASMIALGVAKEAQHKQVWSLDGDGSVLMHMGALPIIGNSGANNFRHVIFNNGCHDSVGGQQTVALEKGTSLASIASASGYKMALEVKNEDELQEGLVTLQSVRGPALLEIKVNSGHRPDVGRPTSEPKHNKKIFMEHIIAYLNTLSL